MKAIVALGPSSTHPQGLLGDTSLSFQPLPGPGDLRVRVRVEAEAVNPVDLKVRAGPPPEGPPRVLGWDAAGVVEAVGEEVERGTLISTARTVLGPIGAASLDEACDLLRTGHTLGKIVLSGWGRGNSGWPPAPGAAGRRAIAAPPRIPPPPTRQAG